MYSRTVICSVFLYSFCLRSNFSTAASVLKTNQTAVKTTKYVGKNSTFFVTTRSGFDGTVEPETACKCAPFYGCNEEDSFQIPDNPNPCPQELEVCCKVPFSLVDDEIIGLVTASEPPKTLETTTTPIPPCKNPGGIGLMNVRAPDCDTDIGLIGQLKCGERRGTITPRVVAQAGENYNTSFGEFPFMASIWASKTEFVCGASLISGNMLLTAAHCVNKKDSNALSVRVGDYDITGEAIDEVAPHEEKAVFKVVVHPDFNSQSLKNDLAIIVTADSFKLNYHIFPVCTVAYDKEFADSNIYNASACLATGWGKSSTESQEPLSSTLKKVDLGVVPFDQCEKKLRRTPRLGGFFKLDSSFICAGGIEGIDTCSKDGGGPLVCPLLSNPYRYVQIGVTSWGVGCGSDTPGVYASLQASEAWISLVYDQYKPSDSALTNESSNLEISSRKI